MGDSEGAGEKGGGQAVVGGGTSVQIGDSINHGLGQPPNRRFGR